MPDVVRSLNNAIFDFSVRPNPSLGVSFEFFDLRIETWTFPPWGFLKVNVEAVFSKGVVAFACIVHNDSGLLVLADSFLDIALSAFTTKLMVVNWAISLAVGKGWRNIIFSSHALKVVEEVNSSKN